MGALRKEHAQLFWCCNKDLHYIPKVLQLGCGIFTAKDRHYGRMVMNEVKVTKEIDIFMASQLFTSV